jgi:2'-5' RNA ligase
LRNHVNNHLSLCGIMPEQRKFHPHVTLARLKNSSAKRVASFLAANALLESPPFSVDQVILYSSTLHPAGAIHRVEAVYPLVGP